MRARMLITAFEAFGGDPINPTELCVLRWMREGLGTLDAVFAVLPVTYDGAPRRLAEVAAREAVDACLMFGLSGRAEGLKVERSAYNHCAAEIADNDGVWRNGTRCIDDAPSEIRTAVDVAAMVAALAAEGVPAVLSDDPGRFVCNATYLTALCGAGPWAGRSVFVHVPATEALGGDMSQAVIEGWMARAVEAFARAVGAH